MATVVAADLGRLAQIRFGGKVYFKIATQQEALKLKRRNRAYLNQIQRIANDE